MAQCADRPFRWLGWGGMVLLLMGEVGAAPRLLRVHPVGGQRGKEIELELLGKHLRKPLELHFYEPGVTVLELAARPLPEPKNDKQAKQNEKERQHPDFPRKVRAKIRLDETAALGEHRFRLRCEDGFSELRTFWVGAFPSVSEQSEQQGKKDKNNRFEEAQKVALNVTVMGSLIPGERDFYQFAGKKGQRLSLEIEALRLGRRKVDPRLFLYDAKRQLLAQADDSPAFLRDCALSVRLPADGDYYVVVQEVAADEKAPAPYRLHLGDFPRPQRVFPLGVRPGETVPFIFEGDAAGPQVVERRVGDEGFEVMRPDPDPHPTPGGLAVRLSPLPTWGEGKPPEIPPEGPAAFEGVIAQPNEQDEWDIQLKKGKKMCVEVFAARLGSELDSVLQLIDPKKKSRSNDEGEKGQPDSRLEWTVEQDGVHRVVVRDLLREGSPAHRYRLEITEVQPVASFSLPDAEVGDSQGKKMVNVPQGGRLAIVPNLRRAGLKVDWEGRSRDLPPGVRAVIPTISKEQDQFPILFEAEAQAPLQGALGALELVSKEGKQRAAFFEEIAHVETVNVGVFHQTRQDRLAVAVTPPAPFELTVEPLPGPLILGCSVPVKVQVTRREGFKESVLLTFPWRPPGVSAFASLEVPAGQEDVLYWLNASEKAVRGRWSVLFTGKGGGQGDSVRLSSPFVTLQVEEPYLKAELTMVSLTQGQSVQLPVRLEKLRDFSESGTVTLEGLPPGVSVEPVSFQSDQSEVLVTLKAAADAPLGSHRTHFAVLTLPREGQILRHQSPTGVILKIRKAAPAPIQGGAPAQKPAAPPARSRLEELRARSAS